MTNITADNAKEYNQTEFAESNFGIRSKEDLKHIFSVMRNKIYSNKILAVLREYSTNACDAHIESGQRDRPIEVTLPTPENCVLSIRDFGKGLSEEEIRNIYTMYGASTKRGSTELNGQLGFGSKAAFSYTDNYTIISYHNGQKTVYEAYIDETELGAISQISKEDTNESGIEIRISVRPRDIESFHKTANDLYKYFEVVPKVNNLSEPITKPVYKLRRATWGLREFPRTRCDRRFGGSYTVAYNRTNVVVMGNVAYPLNYVVLLDNLKHSKEWSRYSSLLECPIDFFVPVGQLSIAASREALEYDKKSLRYLQQLFDTVIQEIIEEFNKNIAAAKDIVEAKRYYGFLMRKELAPLAGVVEDGQQVIWNGQVIDSPCFTIPSITHTASSVNEGGSDSHSEPSFSVQLFEKLHPEGSVKRYRISLGSSIEITDQVKLFHKDVESKPLLRMHKFFQDNPNIKSAYLFQVTPHTTIEQIAAQANIPINYFASLAAQAPLVVERNSNQSRPRNAKYHKKIFRMADSARTRYTDSSFWETAEANSDEERYYVYLDSFRPKLLTDGLSIPNGTFRSAIHDYEELTNTDLHSRIVGIKVNLVKKDMPANWHSLKSVVQDGLKKLIADSKSELEITLESLVVHDVRYTHSIFFWLGDENIASIISQLDSNSPLHRFYTRYRRAIEAVDSERTNYNTSLYYRILRICQALYLPSGLEGVLGETQKAVTKDVNKLFSDYPLLEILQDKPCSMRKPEVLKSLKNYIEFTDSTRK